VSDNGNIANTTKPEIKPLSEPEKPVKKETNWAIEEEFKPQPLFEDEVVEEEPQVDERDVADLYWCPLHNEAWTFEKYKGYGHWITAERGHTGKIPKEIGINHLWLILGNTFNDANVAMDSIFSSNNNVEDIKGVMDIHNVTTVGGLIRKAMDIVLEDDSIVWWD